MPLVQAPKAPVHTATELPGFGMLMPSLAWVQVSSAGDAIRRLFAGISGSAPALTLRETFSVPRSAPLKVNLAVNEPAMMTPGVPTRALPAKVVLLVVSGVCELNVPKSNVPIDAGELVGADVFVSTVAPAPETSSRTELTRTPFTGTSTTWRAE